MGTQDNPLGERLVSVVFAHPGSHVWSELETNRAFLDSRSGEKWDLFFAGLSAGTPMPHEANPFKTRAVQPWRAAAVQSQELHTDC